MSQRTVIEFHKECITVIATLTEKILCIDLVDNTLFKSYSIEYYDKFVFDITPIPVEHIYKIFKTYDHHSPIIKITTFMYSEKAEIHVNYETGIVPFDFLFSLEKVKSLKTESDTKITEDYAVLKKQFQKLTQFIDSIVFLIKISDIHVVNSTTNELCLTWHPHENNVGYCEYDDGDLFSSVLCKTSNVYNSSILEYNMHSYYTNNPIHIQKCIFNNEKFKSIQMNYKIINNIDARNIENLKNLKHLIIDCNYVSNFDILCLPKGLKKLYIINPDFSFLPPLCHFTELLSLTIFNINYTQEPLKKLLDANIIKTSQLKKGMDEIEKYKIINPKFIFKYFVDFKESTF